MKIFGDGVLYAGGTRRVVWDFSNGMFDSANPNVILDAKRQGFKLGPEAVALFEARKATPAKRGRKPKGEKA